MKRIQAIVLGVLLCAADWASGLYIILDANAEQCFHDTVALHTKMGLTFEVTEGGFLDIDVRVRTHITKAWAGYLEKRD